MRLSEWRQKAPVRDALGPRVMAVLGPVLGVLDVEDDPQVWVMWGEDPGTKFSVFAPIAAGLVIVVVRPNTGIGGPRAMAKIVRWSRVQIGELAVETEGPHRMISFQVESAVLRGADAVADAIGRFALVLLAAIEGRPWPAFDPPALRRRASAGAGKAAATKGTGAKGAGAKGAGAKGTGAKGAPTGRGASGPGRAAATDRRLPALPARTSSPGPASDRRSTGAIDRRRSQA